MNVLVIDDEHQNVMPLFPRRLMDRCSFHRAKGLVRARRSLAQLQIGIRDLIILDLMFPSDPEEGLRFLRYLKGPTSQIPRGAGIVVHTNATAPHYRKLAYEAGADEFLAKGEARQLIDLVDLYSGGEVLVAQTLCRVVDVDLMKGKVAVEIDGADGWVAERAVDLQQCPNEARIAGGAFYLDSYKRFRFYPGSRVLEYSILSRAVDESEEQKKLAYLFSEVDN